MKEKAKTVTDLKKEMICHLNNETSLVLNYKLTGTYLIDSIEKDDTLFVRDIKGPSGVRYMLKKETVFNNLDKIHITDDK